MSSNIFDRLSFWSLFLVVTLLPVFLLPFSNITVETSKGLLLVLGLTLGVIFWAIARFFDGKIVFSKSYLLLSMFGVSLVFLLSALFSKNTDVSLFGTMFDLGSFWFIFASFIFMFMTSVIFKNSERSKIVLLGVILSSVFVLIFQSFYLFLPKFFSLGVLSGNTGNLVGSWNALGLFAGFACLLFLLVIEFFPVSKTRKIFLEICILLSILVIMLVNFSLIWVLLGISSLLIFVYKVSITFHRNENEGDKKEFPVISFIVVMITLLFFMAPSLVGGLIPARLQVINSEIGPSLSTTLSITKGVIMKNPVFGIGPNRFGEAWAMHKPMVVNGTQFWDVAFSSGSGLLPTFIATTGILGLLAWVIFLVLFLFIGIKAVFTSIKNKSNWEMVAFFILSLYLFISSFFYTTGITMFVLAIAFAGIFVGLSTEGDKEKTIEFLNDHRKSFFSILALIVLIIFSAAISFKFVGRFVSVSYFGKSLSAKSVPEAESAINKALSLYTNDLYLRTYSQVYLVKLNTLANKGSNLTDADKADLQTSFDQAVKSAQLAVDYNSSNYQNFQLLGSVYQTVGGLGVKDAYGKAVTAYKAASALNPYNPGLKLSIAGVLFVDGNVKEAKDFAKEALALKADYLDALITLSQIAKSEGNATEAMTYAQTALSYAPTDKNLIQYVNSLSSNNNTPAPTPAPVPTPIPVINKTKK